MVLIFGTDDANRFRYLFGILMELDIVEFRNASLTSRMAASLQISCHLR